MRVRRSKNQVRVARVLLETPEDRHWGYETGKAAGLLPGAITAILHRWFAAGWLTDGWEDLPAVRGRPPRRYFTVTERGRLELAWLASGEAAGERRGR
jgi:PadR family transcriptional regulator PadR